MTGPRTVQLPNGRIRFVVARTVKMLRAKLPRFGGGAMNIGGGIMKFGGGGIMFGGGIIGGICGMGGGTE